MMKRLLLALVCSVAIPFAVADRIEFANGDVITGTVTSMAGGKVVVQTDYAGRITASLEKVVRISTDAELNLLTKSGENFVSPLDGEAATVRLTTLDRELALADVSKASRAVEGASLTATDWAHKADVAAALTKGNTDTQSFSVFTESLARTAKNEHLLTIGLFQDEVDEVTTRELFDVDYGYKHFLANDKWFLGGNAEYFKDKLLGIDPRITAGAGLGYRFWDNTLGSLTVEMGGSAVYEDLGEGSETNPAARWALAYRRLLAGERLEFFHRHQILKILGGGRGEVLDSSTGLSFLFDEWWSATLRADLRHQTEPPIGSHRSDFTYTVGVGVRF
jgi:putative salt-induced outer membrane protein YdiY